MVFQLYKDNRAYPIVDIENYWNLNDYDKKYYQNISVHICPKGYGDYVRTLEEKDYRGFVEFLDKYIMDLNFDLHEFWVKDFSKRKEGDTYPFDEVRLVDKRIRERVELCASTFGLNINED